MIWRRQSGALAGNAWTGSRSYNHRFFKRK